MKEYPDLNTNDTSDFYQRRMLEQMVTPGLTNPNNCQTCDYMKMGDGDGHCYMFKDAPTEVCMQHTGRKFPPMHLLDIVPDDTDVMDALFMEGIDEMIREHDLEFSYSMPEMVADAMRKWKKAMNKRKKQARARTGRR